MLPLVITTSSLDIPNLHQQSWQTTLAHQLLQVIQLSDLITTNPTCVQDNLLYFGSTLIVEWETNQSTISRLHCHITATLPYHGYFAISRLFCHIKVTLPYHGYFAISRLFCHIKVTLPYHGYFTISRLLCHIKVTLPYHGYIAISRLLCHQCEAILPPMQAQRLQDHPWPSLIISFDLLLLELQTNECNGQSKTHQKLFQ